MIDFRDVQLKSDGDLVQDMFLSRAFESAAPESRRKGLNHYRQEWLGTTAAQVLLKAFEESLEDRRTIAKVIAVNQKSAGIVWATFGMDPAELPYMDLRLVAFHLHFQRQGLGRIAVKYVEERAAEHGALTLRSSGSAPSDGVRRFHESLGFEPVVTIYEKKLVVAS